MKWKLAPAFAVFLLLLALGAAATAAPLAAVGRHFRDSQGAAVILRGINIAGNSKVPPFLGLTSAAQLDPLPGWGVNVIRLVFNWEAYELSPGVYNEAYLDYIETIAHESWNRGMYVIVDVHQDGYSRYLADGCGEGFPFWALPAGLTLDAPDNGPACIDWIDRVKTDPDVHAAFAQFLTPGNAVRGRFLLLWGRLATRFADHPGVIGYDILNEPWGLEATGISALYEDVAAVIRQVDPDSILFIEPHIAVGGGAQTGLPKPSFGNFAYAPHFYDPQVVRNLFWTGDSTLVDTAFLRMNGRAAAWQVPLFLGEFGGSPLAGNVIDYIDLLYSRLNTFQASSAQWNYTPGWTPGALDGWNAENYSIVDDAGQLRGNYRVRPYPQRIAGTAATIEEDVSAPSINVLWLHNPAAGQTSIFAPRHEVLGGAAATIVTMGAALACSYDAGEVNVLCSSPTAGFKRVVIRPCHPAAETCE